MWLDSVTDAARVHTPERGLRLTAKADLTPVAPACQLFARNLSPTSAQEQHTHSGGILRDLPGYVGRQDASADDRQFDKMMTDRRGHPTLNSRKLVGIVLAMLLVGPAPVPMTPSVSLTHFVQTHGFAVSRDYAMDTVTLVRPDVSLTLRAGSPTVLVDGNFVLSLDSAVDWSASGMQVPSSLLDAAYRVREGQSLAPPVSHVASQGWSPQVTPSTTPASLPTQRLTKIILDAGHGGHDPGNVNEDLNLEEKDIALAITLKVRDLLRARLPSVTVSLTRHDDDYPELQDRVDHAHDVQDQDQALFVSIHADSSVRQAAKGITTFYFSDNPSSPHERIQPIRHSLCKSQFVGRAGIHEEARSVLAALMSHEMSRQSRLLAQAIQSNLISRTNTDDRGVRNEFFFVNSYIAMPSVLVETGFLSNRQEATRLAQASYQSTLADGIATGIIDYIRSFNLSSGLHRRIP